MKFKSIQPSVSLQQYVDYYLILEKTSDEESFPIEVLPAPHCSMTFTYGDPDSSSVQRGTCAVISALDYSVDGYFTQKTSFFNASHLGVIMVGFKPWGVQPFLDFTVQEVTDDNVDLKCLHPSLVRQMEDSLRCTASDEERILIIEKFLLSILRHNNPDALIVDAVHSIVKSNGHIAISQLAKNYHLCQKQFYRKFISAVGINPKFFSRVVRFQHILGLMDNMQFKQLDYALNSGFYDQAHFIKEFRRFTGYTPKEYLENKPSTEIELYFHEQSEKSIFYNTVYM